MSSQLEIAKMLVLSTAHITDDCLNVFLDTYEHAYDKAEFGVFVFVDTEACGLPSSLQDCYDFALEQNCEWLMFDADGPILEELTVYDW